MANLAGQSVKGYELLERIGAGGFGAVYRSYQSTLGREVAVKVILPGYANRPDFIRRFEMEAQLVARLEHLHIVPLYDYWRDPDGAYLVMRWMRGGSLKDALQEGPFDLVPAALLLDQVAAGLAAAHSQGVIHCDLKPSNILLDEEGNAYLGDFGIARILRNGDGSPAPEGGDLASYSCMSPEQVHGEPPTLQTDIYGLGVLLYQALTGRDPFPGTSPLQRLYKHLDDPLPRIDSLGNGSTVQEEVNRVIQKATAKDPGQRFQDALEMASALRIAAQVDSDLTVSGEALTPREDDILERIVEGLTNREIAEDLFIEVTTVKWYITQIYRKLGVRSRKQAIARVQEARVLAADEEGEALETAVETVPEPPNPYKGLRAFDVSDARDFYGREELIRRLLSRLSGGGDGGRLISNLQSPVHGHFLAIVGPSGSGKSSLVKAGLIPALRRGEAPGSDRWYTVQLMPGRRPLDRLEIALTRVAADQSANLRGHLVRDAFGLLRVAELILPQNDSELLVVIDQFEEVFTLVEDEATRAHFLALLATAAGDPDSRVRVILTLRADYYDRPLHYPKFGELLRNQMETVLPLSAEALERAILRPAERVGVGFEPGLVGTIVDDVQYQPGALPLLQYALTELFEEREGRLLTHAAYQSIGGTAGALARRAEELYREQDSEGREALRQLFLRLVSLNEDESATPDTRQRVPRSELGAVVADGDLMDELVDTYAAYRLLTLDHEPQSRRPTVEVAHEALLREWQRLGAWLEESREDLRLQRRLARAAEEWRRAGEDPSFLLRGARLAQFEAWNGVTDLVLTAGEREYLQASATRRHERAAAEAARQAREVRLERRARWVQRALMIVFLLAAVISGWFALEANRQRGEAERNSARSESQRLAAEANSVLERGGSPELAALLALRALGASYTPQADLALQRASAAHLDSALINAPGGPIQPLLYAQAYGAFAPLVSPDNRYLRFRRFEASGLLNQVIELWDMQTMEPLWQADDFPLLGYLWVDRDFVADHSGVVLSLRPDETELTLLDVNSGEPVRTFTGNTSPLVSYQLSADGTVLVAGTEDGIVHVWNAQSGNELRRFVVGGGGYSRLREDGLFVAVSPNGGLVAAKAGGETHVWDIETGQVLYRFEHEPGRRSPPQFADGGRLLMTTTLPDLSLWDLDTGRDVEHGIVAHQMVIHLDVRRTISKRWLSPDGRYYVEGLVGLPGNDIAIWEVATGKLVHRLTGHTGGAFPYDFSSDSRRLVTGGGDGTARVWDLASGQELLVLAGHSEAVTGADFSPDDRYLVTTGRDGAVLIWDLQAPLRREDNQLEGVRDALYRSPDGRVALTADPDREAAILVDADTFEVLHHLDFAPDAAGPAFSSDGRMVVGVRDLQTVLVYDVSSGGLVGEYANPDGVYRYAAFVPGSRTIFAGGDHGAYLLHADTGEQLREFPTPGAGLYGANSAFVTVSPDGRYGALHVWTANSLNVVYLWDLETGVLEYRSTPKADDVVEAFAFSEDSRYFAWGGSNNTAYVLDVQRGEEVIRLAHLNPVLGIDFSSDNRLLLTSSLDASVNVWDLESGEVVRRFFAGAGAGGFVEFVEDDAFVLYTTAEDGIIHRQPFSMDGLVETLCSRVQRDLTAEERRIYGLDDVPTCPKFARSSGQEASAGQ